MIPGFNDDDANIEATADFIINDLNGHVRTLQLLSFMRLGEEKYKSLNIPYKMADLKFNRRSLPETSARDRRVFQQTGHPLSCRHQGKRQRTGIRNIRQHVCELTDNVSAGVHS